MALARKSHQSETEREFCEILQMADPIVSRFVSEHEALRQRNEALLERVAVLERGLEQIAIWAEYGYQDLSSGGVLSCVKKRAKEALDG